VKLKAFFRLAGIARQVSMKWTPVGLQTLRPDGVPGCKCLKGFGRAAGI